MYLWQSRQRSILTPGTLHTEAGWLAGVCGTALAGGVGCLASPPPVGVCGTLLHLITCWRGEGPARPPRSCPASCCPAVLQVRDDIVCAGDVPSCQPLSLSLEAPAFLALLALCRYGTASCGRCACSIPSLQRCGSGCRRHGQVLERLLGKCCQLAVAPAVSRCARVAGLAKRPCSAITILIKCRLSCNTVAHCNVEGSG